MENQGNSNTKKKTKITPYGPEGRRRCGCRRQTLTASVCTCVLSICRPCPLSFFMFIGLKGVEHRIKNSIFNGAERPGDGQENEYLRVRIAVEKF